MPVVADDDDRAFVIIEGADQRLARIDIKVVGWLVEDQQVRGVAGDERQRQPRPLAARHFADRLRCHIAGKAKPAKLRPDSRWRRTLHQARHMFERCVAPVEFFDLILGEIADPHFTSRPNRPLHRFQLRGQQPGERGLAVTVPTEQGDAVVGVHSHVEARQHRLAAITDRSHVELHQWWLQLRRRREVEHQAGVVDLFGDRLHPRQCLGA